MVRPMLSMLQLVARESWNGDDTSQSTSKVLLALCFPLLLHPSVLCWHPNASGLSVALGSQLVTLWWSSQVVVINDKSRAMQKNCGNAKNFGPRCPVLCCNHWTFLSKEALQGQSCKFLPSGRDKGLKGQKVAVGLQMLWHGEL